MIDSTFRIQTVSEWVFQQLIFRSSYLLLSQHKGKGLRLRKKKLSKIEKITQQTKEKTQQNREKTQQNREKTQQNREKTQQNREKNSTK